MEKIVVDTSVIIKWYVTEEKSDQAKDLYRDHITGKVAIIVPTILTLELMNALYYSYRMDQKALALVLRSITSAHLNWHELQMADMPAVTKLMNVHSIASYDSLFITIAQKYKCPLITSDKKNHRRDIYKGVRYL